VQKVIGLGALKPCVPEELYNQKMCVDSESNYKRKHSLFDLFFERPTDNKNSRFRNIGLRCYSWLLTQAEPTPKIREKIIFLQHLQ